LLYHFVVLFVGVFPASIFMLKSFRKIKDGDPKHRSFNQWMIILFWLVLILFTIVNTKIVHYSSMCYFPMSFLATSILFKIFEGKQKFDKWMKILIAFMSILIGSLVLAIQFVVMYKAEIIASGLIKDDFAVANLDAEVYWSGFEFLVGAILIFGVLWSIFLFKDVKKQIIGILVSSLMFVNLTMVFIVPKIEQYSQNAAISFYKEISKENCYLDTFGFKSYAIYYYFNKQKPENKNSYDQGWLYSGAIDKPVYIVCKITSEKQFTQNYPKFTKLYSKNGFVFFKREVENIE